MLSDETATSKIGKHSYMAEQIFRFKEKKD